MRDAMLSKTLQCAQHGPHVPLVSSLDLLLCFFCPYRTATQQKTDGVVIRALPRVSKSF